MTNPLIRNRFRYIHTDQSFADLNFFLSEPKAGGHTSIFIPGKVYTDPLRLFSALTSTSPVTLCKERRREHSLQLVQQNVLSSMNESVSQRCQALAFMPNSKNLNFIFGGIWHMCKQEIKGRILFTDQLSMFKWHVKERLRIYLQSSRG